MKNQSSPIDVPFTVRETPFQEGLKFIFNILEDAFFLMDKDFRINLANEAAKTKAKDLFGVEIEKGTSVLELASHGNWPFENMLFAEVLEGATKCAESVVRVKDDVYYFQNELRPVIEESGNVAGIVFSMKDITAERTFAETRDSEYTTGSEQQYKTLFENNPIPCWIYEFDTLRFLEVNEAAITHYGYTKEEFLRLTILDLQVEKNLAELKNRIETKKIRRVDFLNNWQHRLKDGRSIFVDLRSSAIVYQGVNARIVVAQDVTPRVITENELRKSNERFRLASIASSEALWEWDVLTEEAYISPTYTDVFGWEADEFRKFDEWHDYIHPDDREKTIRSYYEVIGNPATDKWEMEYRYLKADGSYAFVHDKALIVRDAEGKAVKVIGALRDISGQKQIQEELRKSNERFLLASRAASDAIYEWNVPGDELYWGEGLQTLFGYNSSEVSKDIWENLIHPEERNAVLQSLDLTLLDPFKKIWNHEYRFTRANGDFSYVLERGFIVRDAEGRALRMIGSLQDITERKLQEKLLSLERSIFELSANPDLDLKEVVEPLLIGVEEIYPEMITSVLLLKDDDTLEHLVSPRIPTEFSLGINGLKIGPGEGSCGSAMFLKQSVIVDNIETDPLWANYKDFALRFELRACWSLPIIHTSGKVIGSFAVYYKKPRNPTSTELSTVERLRNILRIIIENRLSLQEIKIANERFDIMMNATHDMVWDWNLETNIIYRDPVGLKKVYGIENNDSIESISKWLKCIHPEDYPRVENVIGKILRSVDENNFDVEYRFKREDGVYSYIYDRGIIIRDENNKPLRMIGAAQDISERKRLEKELLNNELEHQRAINQATIETQEQERTEIGKELHDNVNQVLTTTKLYLDLALSNPELKDELIQKSTKNIINVINEIRQLSRSLMDPSIGDLGLIDSIHDLIENINLTRKLHVSLSADETIEEFLDKNQKLTLFRIIQEALNNAIRHAKATSVIIEIRNSASSAWISIKDDGIGFDVKTVKKGAGLKNIQNRIYLINGTHTIESMHNQGSTIIINFPITQLNKLHPH